MPNAPTTACTPLGTRRRAFFVLLALVLLVPLAGCGSREALGQPAGAPASADATASVRQTVRAGLTATTVAELTATAAAEVELQNAQSTARAERRATVSAQIYLVETASAGRAQQQTATSAAATSAAAPTATATPAPTATSAPAPTARPAAAPRPTAPPPQPQRLRFVKLNENDDPTCISVAIRGIGAGGWSFRVDGTGVVGSFDGGGNARACGLAPRQEVTLTIFNAQGSPVRGGQGVPARGSAIMQGSWQ